MSIPVDERRTLVNRLAELRVKFYALDVISYASADYEKWKQLLDEIRRVQRLLDVRDST